MVCGGHMDFVTLLGEKMRRQLISFKTRGNFVYELSVLEHETLTITVDGTLDLAMLEKSLTALLIIYQGVSRLATS